MSVALRLCLAAVVSCAVARNVKAETPPQGASVDQPASCRKPSQPFARTELYVGAGRHPGPRDQKTWRDFLARVVTPRFRDGLTVLEGAGQWRGPHGVEREHAHVIILLYRPDAQSDQKIDAIREAYKKRFKQQSVLRVDIATCVSF